MYMGEKLTYYKRREDAISLPRLYESTISDGIAKSHTRVPWLANLKDSKKMLEQHLQGNLSHGRFMRIYRTFNNVKAGCNLAIHCWLMNLERVIEKENKLPPTVYYQVDGGSENTARAVLAICELLIIKRLTTKIIFTRLVVGHTHEDIDSKFGKIWTEIRNNHVLSPDDFEYFINKVLKSDKQPVEIVDLFVLPNYQAILEPIFDKEFGLYAKEENTVLQFTFEAVERCPDFPLGCKVSNSWCM